MNEARDTKGRPAMTGLDCKTCRELLPEAMAESGHGSASPDILAHLAACDSCRHEWDELQSTWALLDEWTAPEPSAYFDTRLMARLREAEAAPPEGLWERLTAFLRFSTGWQFRPALAGVLVFVLLLGGTAASFLAHHSVTASDSPAVDDLKIYDKNAQALQEMDLLDDAAGEQSPAVLAPHS